MQHIGGSPQHPTIVPASERSVQTIVVIQWVGMVYTKEACEVAKGAVIGLDLSLGLTPRSVNGFTARMCNKAKISHW